VEKIGKDIIKIFYKNEWDKYSKTLETFNMIFYIDIKKMRVK
jgi:hemoglobin-like flavoprotein